MQMPILKPQAGQSALRILHFRLIIHDGHNLDLRTIITSRLSERRTQHSQDVTQGNFLSPAKSNSASRNLTRFFSQNEAIGSEVFPFAVDADMFIDFAVWAFGPTGLPHLRILAIGDFSYNSRYEGQQIAMVRRRSVKENAEIPFDHFRKSKGGFGWSESFDIATVTDHDTCVMTEKSDWEFLSSCPSDDLLDNPFG